MILGQVLAPISTVSVSFAGYYLFQDNAIIYFFIIGVASSIINFSLARKYGWTFLRKLFGEYYVDNVKDILEGLDSKSLIFARIFSFTINDFASYAFGFTKMMFRDFIFYSILGQLIWMFLWEAFLKKLVNNALSFAVVFIIVSIPFAIFIREYLKVNKQKKNN
jgi:uncharacterized membrane protein YdjX (TVP38/TMEM64 family)